MAAARLQEAYKRQMPVGSNRTPKSQPEAGSASSDSRRILVAVDFGTTYSAAAWVQTRAASTQNPHFHIVMAWPEHADETDSVPTVLQYSEDGKMTWGFACDTVRNKFQWFKLEQDPKYKTEQLEQALPAGTLRPQSEQQAKDLITQYLELLRIHVEKSVKDHLDTGGKRQSALLRDVRWEYIITVPAMWPESAQNITEKCAKEAGMAHSLPVKIIPEPEAAGIYALARMCEELELEIGDTFVICDAGGGTVDLISYRITKLGPNPELEEAAAGTGGLCGSSFLDREFHKWLTRHISECEGWDSGYTADAMARWETEIKRNFNGNKDKKYQIPCRGISDNKSSGIEKGYLTISSSKIKRIFAPVIEKILELVKDQMKEVQGRGKGKVNAVLLAGGFGRNEYLKDSIQAAVGKAVKVKRMIDWYPGGVDGGERIDVMRWLVKKHDRVKDLEQMTFDFYYDQLVKDANWNGRLDTIRLPIYVCEKDVAPDYPDPVDARTKINKKLVEVKADLDRIPKTNLNREKGKDDKEYYKIGFQIVMMRNLASVTFKLVHDGIEYGTVDAEWDTT